MSDLLVSVKHQGVVGLEPVHKIASDEKFATESHYKAKPLQETTSLLSAQERVSLVDDLNEILQEKSPHLSFSVDDRSGENIVSVIDSESGEMIRQMPSEELLVLREKMDDLTGIIFDRQV